MSTKGSPAWQIIQAVSGTYCAVFATIAYFFPRTSQAASGQSMPIAQTVISPWLIGGLIALGLSVSVPAVLSVLKGEGGKAKRSGVATPEAQRVVFARVLGDCGYLLRSYRKLQFDFPAETRYPLNPDSWPNFNPPATWTYVQVRLCCLSSAFDLFIEMTRAMLDKVAFTDYIELFNVIDNIPKKIITIADLLRDLEQLDALLKKQIDALGERK